MSSITDCPFCVPRKEQMVASTKHFLILKDSYPISPWHLLITPKRHVTSIFHLSSTEWRELYEALNLGGLSAQKALSPEGFNLGIKDGRAAGQTVEHLHVHLVPRHIGDQEDSRGGIRKIFPEKAKYWERNK